MGWPLAAFLVVGLRYWPGSRDWPTTNHDFTEQNPEQIRKRLTPATASL